MYFMLKILEIATSNMEEIKNGISDRIGRKVKKQ